MEIEIIVIIIIGILIYLLFKSSGSKNRPPVHNRQIPQNRPAPNRIPGPRVQNQRNYINSAKQQENQRNYNEASRLYLLGGQIFSAAKMKLMMGLNEVDNAMQIIRSNAPNQIELISRNLANEFYYKLSKPAISSAILRSIGLIDEAIAVEVASGIQSPISTVSSTPSSTSSIPSPVVSTSSVGSSSVVESSVVESNVEVVLDEEISKESSVSNNDSVNVPNTLLMASSTIDGNCVVCKKAIKTGDSFIYCLNCGKPGHYKHLGEMMKVTGKCPSCKQRLVINMYDL
ncbi:MAG: E3 ubiquitin protein ligase [Candidatus Heimdallarchaeota archaeon]|nr:E3 ubiquitin protein ligase [Candidatus Heimdallarchaeota archaeon]MDH5645742.1 E3 ubiquitin protein ligase [Candidatus Heimdallarchaeota archaeon]